MASYRAPGVQVKEIDISEVAVPAGTNVGALVGRTPRGMTNRRVLTTSNKDFVSKFGAPVYGDEYPMYTALEYLKESDFLWFTRPATKDDTVGCLFLEGDTLTPSAVPEADGDGIFDEDGYEDGNQPNKYWPAEKYGKNKDLCITALGGSKENENIGIVIVTEQDVSTSTMDYTYGYTWEGKYPAKDVNGTENHFYRINVYTKSSDETEEEAGWTSETAEINPLKTLTPAESWVVSNNPLAKDYSGNSMYVKDVVNGYSDYIYATTNGEAIDTSIYDNEVVALGAGSYDHRTSEGIVSCWTNLYATKEQVTPNILMAPYVGDTEINEALVQAVCEIVTTRRDCFAVVPASGLNMTKADQIVAYVSGKSYMRNSYCGIYAGADLIFDQYTNRNIYLPKVCFAGRIIVHTFNVANVWDAPAGLNRGAMNTLDQLKVYTEAEIGYMYANGINTSKRVRGAGDFMWGQKTGQVKASALDRINVRNLLLYIENTLDPSLQTYLFDANTDLQQSRAKSGVDQFIETIYAGGGVYAWKTVCDSTNNTPYTIDNHELNIDVYVQPVKSTEYINLNMIVTKTGVSFTEA